MQITIDLPDNIAHQISPNNISRRVLELIVTDSDRQGRIGAAEVLQMLNFSSRWETYEFSTASINTESNHTPKPHV